MDSEKSSLVKFTETIDEQRVRVKDLKKIKGVADAFKFAGEECYGGFSQVDTKIDLYYTDLETKTRVHRVIAIEHVAKRVAETLGGTLLKEQEIYNGLYTDQMALLELLK